MESTNSQRPGSIPPYQQVPVYARDRHSDRDIVFGIGVVLLMFGPGITGYHQASMIGLALIVLCSLVRF